LQEAVKVNGRLHVNKGHVELQTLHSVPGYNLAAPGTRLLIQAVAHLACKLTQYFQDPELNLLVDVRVLRVGILLEQLDW
jgi:hypothetical protein